MSYPVRPYRVNQGFGKANTDPSVLALYQSMGLLGHDGYDLYATHGEPVHAAHDGIAYWEVDDSQGEGVVLRTNDQFDYKGGKAWFKSIYWHLADSTKEPNFASPVYRWNVVNKGQGMPIKRGELIGYADNTGLSKGDHLHWGCKPIRLGDPTIEDATDVGIGAFTNIEQSNGYFGNVDLAPYLDGLYADTPIAPPVPVAQLSPADTVAVLAAEEQASGDTKAAAILWAFVTFIKSFFK